MRKPVVAYNIPGVNEVVSGDVTGILADWSDDPIARIRNLANAIQELCLDPEKRVKIGTAGFHYVHKHFNPNSLIAEHEKLYAEAISTGRNSRYAERAKIPRQSVQKTIGSAA